jgi:hypothetical protein
MAPLDDELQALYAVHPEDFVRARTDLVRRLRKDGRRDDADVAAKLRRPSATAAALNRVARDEPHLLEALLNEGARLRDAMQRAVQGNAVDVRPSQLAERRAADAVVGAARRRLEELGQRDSDAAAQRINNTLRAAALDESLAQRLRRGMLDTDVVASGFGFGGLEFDESTRAAAPRKKGRRLVQDQTPASEDPKTESKAQQRQAAAQLAALRTEATRLAAAAARLASAADKAQGHVDQLRERSTLLQNRLRDAEREARRARQAADKAGVDAARAQQRADTATDAQ